MPGNQETPTTQLGLNPLLPPMVKKNRESPILPDSNERSKPAIFCMIIIPDIITDHCEGNRLSGDLFISLDTHQCRNNSGAGKRLREENRTGHYPMASCTFAASTMCRPDERGSCRHRTAMDRNCNARRARAMSFLSSPSPYAQSIQPNFNKLMRTWQRDLTKCWSSLLLLLICSSSYRNTYFTANNKRSIAALVATLLKYLYTETHCPFAQATSKLPLPNWKNVADLINPEEENHKAMKIKRYAYQVNTNGWCHLHHQVHKRFQWGTPSPK